MLNIFWKIKAFKFQIWQNHIKKFKRTTKSWNYDIIFVSATKIGKKNNHHFELL